MYARLTKALILTCLVAATTNSAAQHRLTQSDLEARQRAVSRENWQMQGRRIPGFSSATLRSRAIRQKLQMRIFSAAPAAAGAGWSSLGPLPFPSDASGIGLQDYSWVSGRATAVAIDPNDATGNTVFAGGAYGGVWKSTNAGVLSTSPASVTWTSMTDGEKTLAIGAIAVQPQLSNPNSEMSVVLAGTGETNSSADSYYGLGILRSQNGGQTWSLISCADAGAQGCATPGAHSFAGLGFSKIAFSGTNPNLVVAAASSATQGIIEALETPITVNRGLYYSADAGITWHAATVSDTGVSTAPSSATSVIYNAGAGKFFAAIRFHGFYSSSDGINWSRLVSQPGVALTVANCPPTTVTSTCPIYRGEIAVVPNRTGPSNHGEMYIWFVDANDADQGIWQTLDGGATWTQINDSGITNCGDLLGGCGTEQGSYNFALAAVPDGTATDLYAGAINLYKCVITTAFPTCNGTDKNSFLNLTHVYGCSDIAKVHPDQHAIDFLVSNGTALIFMANDGGIYRALDGFTSLTTGTCGLTNQFDSLNKMLGPMTQFVSVAESATDIYLLFGGTQDNGAPATGFSQSGGSWANVNSGDVGFTAINPGINPGDDNEWFVASPPDSQSGVNLFRCTNGINCHTQDFANDQVANSSDLGGDTGAFYFPFILDPASSSTLLIGTCRVWRGASTGGSFSVLSPDFETGGTGACNGTETNMVRALAAGGPTDSSGYSQVIYAGTTGEGPLFPTTPGGGHLWVTTSADVGATSWADRTGPINPNHFPISAIAIDPSSASGQTAYVTIMGFHTPHLWRTTDAGVSWTDFSGTPPNTLPDAPVNSIVIDRGVSGSAGTIYVGTDVGVFSTSTASPSWSEVRGTAVLPNVAVTSLQIFNFGGDKRLRAATYGRGIWEISLITTPDFQVHIADNPQTIFPSSSATFNGTITALNGYAGNVSLNCPTGSAPLPQTCSIAWLSSSTFSVTASGPVGDYFFNVHAVGDPPSTAKDFPLTLHIVDFALGVPSPSSVTVALGAASSNISLTVSALGSFDNSVALSCSGLPAGASCAYQPSSTVTPTKGNPVSVILNIATTSTTPSGTSQISINATTAGEPAKQQTLTLIVSTTTDYTISIANSSLTTQVNTPALFNGTLSAVNGYNNSVALSCGTGAPPSCVVNPSSATPTNAGAPFTVTASSATAQTYNFNVNAVGSDPATIAHSAPVVLTVLPVQAFDFAMGATPTSASVPVGQSALFSVTVNPNTGSFPSAVTFSCTNLPSLSTCTFNPSQVGPGSGNSTTALTIITIAPAAASIAAAMLLLSFPIFGLFWAADRRTMRRLLGLLLIALSCGACQGGLHAGGGGSANPGTPKGTYNITVTAACGSVTHSAQVTLTVH